MTPSEQNPNLSELQTAAARSRSAYQWEDAVGHYTTALSLKDLSPTEEYDLRDGRAFCYQRLAHYQAEYDDLNVMTDLAQGIGEPERFLDAQTRQAIALDSLGEIDKSRTLALAAMDQAAISNLPYFAAKARYAIGLTYTTAGEYEPAIGELDPALRVFKELGALEEEALCAYQLAFAGTYTGQQAEPHAQRVLEIAQQLDDQLLLGRANHILGIVYQRSPSQELAHREQALEIYQSIGEAQSIGSMTHNLGVFYQEFGLIKRAHKLFNQAVLIAEETQSRSNPLLSRHLAALSAFQMGDLDFAVKLNLQVIAEAEEAGIQSVAAFAKSTRALLLWSSGELEAAIDIMEEAADQVKASPALLPFVLGWLGGLYLEHGDVDSALETTEKALEWVGELANPIYVDVPLWNRYRVLQHTAKTTEEFEKAWQPLQQAVEGLLARIEGLADWGLRRSYLNHPYFNTLIIREWALKAHQRGESLAPLMEPQLATVNIQQQFKRLLDTGTRLAAQSDPESLLSFIMDEFVDLSGADRAFIALSANEDDPLPEIVRAFRLEGAEQGTVYQDAAALIDRAILSHQAVRAQNVGTATPENEPHEIHQRSVIVVPLVSHSRVLGVLYADIHMIFGPFQREDADLFTLLANQAAAALENANWTRALEQRVRDRTIELETVNKIGEGLLANLDMDGILEVVGEHVQARFGTQNLIIAFDEPTQETILARYMLLNGERLEPVRIPRDQGLTGVVIQQNAPLLVRSFDEAQNYPFVSPKETEGRSIVAMSWIGVPLRRGKDVIGALCVYELRDGVFDESHVRLLSTIAANMGVSLENARLFDETAQQNAELAVINSVQRGLASKLEYQAIVDLVGEQISALFDQPTMSIGFYDEVEEIIHYRFGLLEGVQADTISQPLAGFSKAVIETGETIVINKDAIAESEQVDSKLMADIEFPKSLVFVPIFTAGKPTGIISLQDTRKENAFDAANVRLLESLAGSLSVALENAQLFDEIQHLLKETEERASELEIINNVQAGLVARVAMDEIHNLVGDRVQEIFDAEVVTINRYDLENQLNHYEYTVEKGERLTVPPQPFNLIIEDFIANKTTMLINQGVAERMDAAGAPVVAGEAPLSILAVPLMSEGRVVGSISLQNVSREHAFNPSDVQLLETLASSLSIALENARLFEAEAARAAELETVNMVSQALDEETELDALIQLIGEQIRQIFAADIVYVALLDRDTDLIEFPYTHGEQLPSIPLGEGLTSKIIESGEPLLINRAVDKRRSELGITQVGQLAASYLGVPIYASEAPIGVISVQSTQVEGRFNEADVRLLSTLAANIGNEIYNASLFDQIKRQKQYYEAVIENSPAAIVLVGLKSEITGWNPAAEKLFGYTEAEAMGRNLNTLIARTEEQLAEARSYTEQTLSEKLIHLITQRTRKDGTQVDVDISALPVSVDGKLGDFIVIYHDITELQRARQAAEGANKAKSTFLANMSHELRTPLNAITGFTRIVRRKGKDTLPEKQLDNLQKVLISADHLLGLINTVLDIAKIEAGRMEVQSHNFDFKPLADLVVATTQPLVEAPVELVSEMPADLPRLHTDQDKVKQILLNLLSNAAKFTHEGRITLRARAAGGLLAIEVQDTGIGISPQALEKIFEEFQQADTSTTREYGGTGLGLSISKNLAQLLGGDLTASSVEGKGSVFALALPIRFGEEPVPEHPQPAPPRAAPKPTGAPLVLAIDDDPNVHDLLKENLGDRGYQVVGASSADEGLRLARELTPFAITLDIMMPQKDGWQVLHELKADLATREIPVILVTIVDKAALGYQLGAADYLVKPLEEDAVLAALERIQKRGRPDGPVRLLVVDDDPNIPDMVRQLLSDAGYRIDAARDGQAALEVIQSQPPDAILLDLMMPRMDGFELIEALRAEGFSIPIIVLTAKTLNAVDLDILETSVEQIIQKNGLDQERLLEEIQKSIEEVRKTKNEI